jgi:hypothetical protein
MICGAALREYSLRPSQHPLTRAETAAQNTAMFMVARVIIGVGITPAIVGASNLISGKSSHTLYSAHTDLVELAHPKERARLGSLFNAFFFTGKICLTLLISKADSR